MKVYIIFCNFGYPYDSIEYIFLNEQEAKESEKLLIEKNNDNLYWIEEHEVI